MNINEMSLAQKKDSLALTKSNIAINTIGLVISLLVLLVGGGFTLLCVAWSGSVSKNVALMIAGCLLFLFFFILCIRSLNREERKRDELVLAIQNEEKKNSTIDK